MRNIHGEYKSGVSKYLSRRTGNVVKSLPVWFKWQDYRRLSNLNDAAIWAWLFASRDPGIEDEIKQGVGVVRVLNSHQIQTKLAWRNGVLCHGMKGHATNEYLTNTIRWAQERESAGFISENEFRTLHASGELHKCGSHFRSFKGGYLVFASKRSLSAYERIEKAAFSRTVEFAVNLQMPKKVLLKEVESIIDEHQKRFSDQRMPNKVSRAKAYNWARGVAAFDLLNDGLLQADVARLLVPYWFNRTPGPKAEDIDKKELRTALKTVKPYVQGGWRTLCGDPLVSPSSPLLPPA